MDPRGFDPKTLAEGDGGLVERLLRGLEPELELVAATAAFVAVVAAPCDVHRERSAMLGGGVVEWTAAVPLLAATGSALELQQFEHLFHGDRVTKPVEVDAWHGWPLALR
jgi:hypothetical protein